MRHNTLFHLTIRCVATGEQQAVMRRSHEIATQCITTFPGANHASYSTASAIALLMHPRRYAIVLRRLHGVNIYWEILISSKQRELGIWGSYTEFFSLIVQ